MKTLKQVYTIAWQPGLFMIQPWWEELDLQAWEECYKQRLCARRFIDQEIIQRRNFPPEKILQHTLTEIDEKFITSLDTLRMKLCALGLWRFAQPEYFLLKNYRHTLTAYFGDALLEQVMSLCPEQVASGFHVDAPLYPEDRLISEAITSGTQLVPYFGISDTLLKLCEILFIPHCLTTEKQNMGQDKLKNYTKHCFSILEKWL